MSDDDHDHEHDGAANRGETPAPDEHDHHDSDTREPRPDERTTAPQSPYTNRQVGIGTAIALLGMLLVFVVPILLTV